MKLPRTEEEIAYAKAQGRVLYERRDALGLTRRAVAVATGISQQAIFRIEMGDSTASAYDLARLATALHTTVGKLCPAPEEAVAPPAHKDFDTLWQLSTRCRMQGAYA